MPAWSIMVLSSWGVCLTLAACIECRRLIGAGPVPRWADRLGQACVWWLVLPLAPLIVLAYVARRRARKPKAS